MVKFIRICKLAPLIPHQALVVLVEDGVGLPAEMLDELNVRLKRERVRAAEIYSFISHCCRQSGWFLLRKSVEICGPHVA